MHSFQQFLQQFVHVLTQRLMFLWQWLRSEADSILASPHRWIVYPVAAAIAVLLIAIPLLRGSRQRRRRRSDVFEEVRSYSVLGIGPLSAESEIHRPQYPRWADVTPLAQQPTPPPIANAAPVPQQPVPPPNANVTPINPSMSMTCTHCGATLSAQQNFCPACGFAQPAERSVTA